jgi:hypothetical protein
MQARIIQGAAETGHTGSSCQKPARRARSGGTPTAAGSLTTFTTFFGTSIVCDHEPHGRSSATSSGPYGTGKNGCLDRSDRLCAPGSKVLSQGTVLGCPGAVRRTVGAPASGPARWPGLAAVMSNMSAVVSAAGFCTTVAIPMLGFVASRIPSTTVETRLRAGVPPKETIRCGPLFVQLDPHRLVAHARVCDLLVDLGIHRARDLVTDHMAGLVDRHDCDALLVA